MTFERYNLVNEQGLYLKHTLTSFTAKRKDAYWSIAGGIDALVKEFPTFGKLIRIKSTDTPQITVDPKNQLKTWAGLQRGIVGSKRKNKKEQKVDTEELR